MKGPLTTEKVNDASLTRPLISSIIVVVLCMVCLLGTTWAWYTSSVESGNNTVVGANFDIVVSINPNVTFDNGCYVFDGGAHTVTLTKTGSATCGFCMVIATGSGDEGNATTYYYIDQFPEGRVSFTVTGSGTLEFISMLGTPPSRGAIPEGGIELTPDPETEEEEEREAEPIEEDAPAAEETELPEPVGEESGQPTETEEPAEEKSEQPNEPTGTEQSETPPAVENITPSESPANTETPETEQETEPVIPEETTSEPQE